MLLIIARQIVGARGAGELGYRRHGGLLRFKRQCCVDFDFLQDNIRSHLRHARQAKNIIIQKLIIGIDIFNDDAQMKISFTTGCKTLKHFRVMQNLPYKVLNILLFVTCERNVHDR